MLRRGGLVFASSPDAQRWAWDDYTHRRPFTRKSFRLLFADQGFSVEHVGYESVTPGVGVISQRTRRNRRPRLSHCWRISPSTAATCGCLLAAHARAEAASQRPRARTSRTVRAVFSQVKCRARCSPRSASRCRKRASVNSSLSPSAMSLTSSGST